MVEVKIFPGASDEEGASLGAEKGFNIAETFLVGELSKGQRPVKGTDPRGIFDVAIALGSIEPNLKLEVGRKSMI
jgi:hypothetical protein